MKNCLVTKLKGVVNDNTLPRLGYLTIQKKLQESFQSSKYVTVNYGEGDTTERTAEIVGGYFVNNAGNNPTTSKELVGNGNFYFSKDAAIIYIPDKYNLKIISTHLGGDYLVPVETLQYCENLTSITALLAGNLEDLDFSKLTSLTSIRLSNGADENHVTKGNIRELAKCPNLTSISLNSCKELSGDISSLADMNLTVFQIEKVTTVTGDISVLNGMPIATLNISQAVNIQGDIDDIGDCTSLSYIRTNASIGGTIEGFVQAQRTAAINPRVTNSTGINCSYIHASGITFGGEAIPSNISINGTLTWTENTITIASGSNSKTVNA